MILKHKQFVYLISFSPYHEINQIPDQADAYNGQQGDMWDAQKDMALAMVGTILMILILKIKTKKNDRST